MIARVTPTHVALVSLVALTAGCNARSLEQNGGSSGLGNINGSGTGAGAAAPAADPAEPVISRRGRDCRRGPGRAGR